MLKWIRMVLVCSCTINLVGTAQPGAGTPTSPDANAPDLIVANSDDAIWRIALSPSTARLFTIDLNHGGGSRSGPANAFMDVYDSQTLQMISRVPVCSTPSDVAVNDYTRRVVVVCDRYTIVEKHVSYDTGVAGGYSGRPARRCLDPSFFGTFSGSCPC